jgi:hypothetical protein
MQRTMKSAVSLVTVYGIKSFWIPVVTLTLFRFESSSANRNRVGTNELVAIIQQQKFVFGLQYDDLLARCCRGERLAQKRSMTPVTAIKRMTAMRRRFTSELYAERKIGNRRDFHV